MTATLLHLFLVVCVVWTGATLALAGLVLVALVTGELRGDPPVPTAEESNAIVYGTTHARNDLQDRGAA